MTLPLQVSYLVLFSVHWKTWKHSLTEQFSFFNGITCICIEVIIELSLPLIKKKLAGNFLTLGKITLKGFSSKRNLGPFTGSFFSLTEVWKEMPLVGHTINKSQKPTDGCQLKRLARILFRAPSFFVCCCVYICLYWVSLTSFGGSHDILYTVTVVVVDL